MALPNGSSRRGVSYPILHTGSPGGFVLCVGADIPFFALLGSAPQELNNTRPEAKLGLKIARTKFKQIFYSARVAVETPYPRMTIVPPIRTIFSLTRLEVFDT
jgi:hypothetical protein